MLRNVAEEEQLENVQSITVEVGTLSGVVPRFLSDCWQAVIDGTEFDAVDMTSRLSRARLSASNAASASSPTSSVCAVQTAAAIS